MKANNLGKFKKTSFGTNSGKKNATCHHWGKKGHFIRDCRFKKNNEDAKLNKANMVEETHTEDIIAMVSEMQIGMITELNMAATVKSSDWWLDSGATIHVCNDRAQFKIYKTEDDGQEVLMGNHNGAKVLGKGTVELQFTSGKTMTLTNVFHVPDIKKNLVYANLLCKSGIKVVLEADKFILSKNGVFVGKGYSFDGMFKLSINKVNSSVYIVDSSSTLWHSRLAHLNYRSLKYLSKHDLISCKDVTFKNCEICTQDKITKKPFQNVQRNTEILDLVHYDICEFNGILTRGGKRYFITFIDDCSRFTYVYLMSNKDEAFEFFKRYKAEVENQKGRKIKVLRSDRGGEYFSNEFSLFCEEHGIIHQKTAPYTPQQNGLAERKNRTLTDMINSMIISANVPTYLWGEALLAACHIQNRITSKKTHVSPYEVWNGRKPNLEYLRVWGCLSFYRSHDPKRSKLGPRGIKSIFVGYAQNSKAYRLLNVNSNVIVESRDVEFFEDKFYNDPSPSSIEERNKKSVSKENPSSSFRHQK